ncbi:hypothetical protein SAMN05428960_4284 [Mitsuaria sp. PDC51]|uniref:hypothetical protein n=1 Tax=Mitsuaria sp. PDC51 TaxID=1881035 RepID=UPI0008EE788B|nr:hypothetical protein [Mitsuaria sp. PDC51]SFR97945.1 hypothetical protein SAMN05428960_4284 [Mitsuaria sp. PDC51]
MIAALNNITTSNGPGATTGQSARVREADDPSTTSQAEASAVVSLSPQAASLAASGAAAPAQATTGPATAVQTATSQPVTAAPPAQPAATQTVSLAAEEPEKFPEPISLVPNLVYAEADSDQNGVISPAERRAYDVVHPTLGQRAADVPPKRVVDAELREYTAIANKQF